MKHFLTYVKHSYQVILEAESKTNINLSDEVEIFVVHTFAKYMERPDIANEPIAVKMLKTSNERGEMRKTHFQEIAEECLLIDGLKLNNRRWPTKNYFKDMGILALENRAYSDRPPELFYERLANQFDKLSFVLGSIRNT